LGKKSADKMFGEGKRGGPFVGGDHLLTEGRVIGQVSYKGQEKTYSGKKLVRTD